MRRENQNYQNLSALFDLQEQQEEVREIQLKVRQIPKSAEKFKSKNFPALFSLKLLWVKKYGKLNYPHFFLSAIVVQKVKGN